MESAAKEKGKRGREMTTVYCNNSECKYLKDGMECGRIMLNLDEDGECEDFEDYHDDKEWQTPFWKRMIDGERKKEVRVEYKGKELEVGGRIFCVDSNSYYATLTDKETGLDCGKMSMFNEDADRIGKITEAAKEYTSVMNLPIAVYDEETHKFSYPDEESEGGESEDKNDG